MELILVSEQSCNSPTMFNTFDFLIVCKQLQWKAFL